MKRNLWKVILTLLVVASLLVAVTACDDTKTYSVTFVGGTGATGAAPTMDEQLEGAKFTLPQNTFAKDGYTFSGWTDGQNTYQAGDQFTMPASQVTFTATWTVVPPTTYTVTFALGEHAATSATAPEAMAGKLANSTVTLPTAVDAADHFTFGGWTDGTTTYQAGENYTVIGNVTLTAVWTQSKYAINFALGEHANSGATAPDAIADKINGDTITLPAAPTAADHYVFVAWTDGANTYDAGATYTVSGNATLTATWKLVQHQVTFNANGGVGENAVTLHDYNSQVEMPAQTTFQRDGYVFKGWATTADGTTAVTGNHTVTQDVTFYAIWAKLHTVTYNLGSHADSSAVAPQSVTVEVGTSITLPAAITPATGYVFKDWSVNGTNNVYQPGDSHVVTEDATIIARWTEVFTVSFDIGSHAAEGTTTPAAITGQFKDATVVLPAALTPAEGYRFTGWYDLNKMMLHKAGAPFGVYGNVTLVAQWEVVITGTFAFTGNVTIQKSGLVPVSVGPITRIELVLDTNTINYKIHSDTYTVTGISLDMSSPSGADVFYVITLTDSNNRTVQAGLALWRDRSKLNIYAAANNEFSGGSPLATFTPEVVTNEHTVTFDPQNDIDEIASIKVEDGKTAFKPDAIPLHATKLFRYWADENGTEFDFSTPITQDITLYATYGYRIRFDIGDGATGTAPEEKWAGYRTQLPDIGNVIKEGYLFKGWSDGVNTYQPGDYYTPTSAATTLTAVWEDANIPQPPFTITMVDSDDASVVYFTLTTTASGSIKYSDRSKVAQKDGYTFLHWSDTPNGAKRDITVESGYTFADDATLYAVFEVAAPTVANSAFVGVWSDGTHEVVIVSQQDYESNEYLYAIIDGKVFAYEAAPANTAERAMLNAATGISCGTIAIVDGGLTVTPASGSAFTIATRTSQTVTPIDYMSQLNGKTFKSETTTILFDNDYEYPIITVGTNADWFMSGAVGSYIYIVDGSTYESSYLLKLDGATLSGYDQNGNAVSFAVPAGYTITFVDGNTTLATAKTNAEGWIKVADRPATPTKNGYTFQHWSLTENGEALDLGGKYFDKNTTVYAVWAEATKYTIEFSSGKTSDAVGDNPTIEAQFAGATITFPANPWTVAHFTFAGYKVQHEVEVTGVFGGTSLQWEDIDSTIYQAGQTYVMPSENIRIVGTWTAATITVALDPNGGTGTMDGGTFLFGSSYYLPESCTFTAPEGKMFAGWAFSDGTAISNSPIGKSKYSAYVTEQETLTIKATWVDQPTLVDIATIAGNWTGYEYTATFSATTLVDSTAAGSAVVNGIAFDVYQTNGGFYGYDYAYNYYLFGVETSDDGAIIGLSVNEELVDILEGQTNLTTAQRSAFLGGWTSSTLTLYVTDTKVYRTLSLSEANLIIVGEYAVFSYNAASTDYYITVKASADTLVGKFYGDPEKAVTAVTFNKGGVFALTVDGAINQLVKANNAPDASKIVAPTAPSGQKFDKWVLAGTTTEFDATAVITADVSITATFVEDSTTPPATETTLAYNGSATLSGFLGAQVGPITKIVVDESALTVTYTIGGNDTTVDVTDNSSSNWKPDGVEKYYDLKIENVSCYVGLSADKNTLYLCNGDDEVIEEYLKEGYTPDQGGSDTPALQGDVFTGNYSISAGTIVKIAITDYSTKTFVVELSDGTQITSTYGSSGTASWVEGNGSPVDVYFYAYVDGTEIGIAYAADRSAVYIVHTSSDAVLATFTKAA